jgi:hypothetical protein
MTRKIELQMIAAIRDTLTDSGFEGCYWKSANTSVWQGHSGTRGTYSHDRWIEVILHGTVVALIEPNVRRVSIYTGGFNTTTTRSRINAVLREFAPGWNLCQRNGKPTVFDRNDNPEPFTEGFALMFDPWHPLRESNRAA